jgi:hypothetical protein
MGRSIRAMPPIVKSEPSGHRQGAAAQVDSSEQSAQTEECEAP